LRLSALRLQCRISLRPAAGAAAGLNPMDTMAEEHSPYKSKGGPGRLGAALRYSARGLGAAFRHEAAFRQELGIAAILAPLAIWIGDGLLEITLLLGSMLLVLIAELFNSAVEALADAISTAPHPLIGRAKDLGSAAVMLSITLSIFIWLAVIARHVIDP